MTTHIIPVGSGELPHLADASCGCGPTRTDARTIVHNSGDGRERYERQGLTHPDKSWIIVLSTEPALKELEFTD